ncbi:hypothetical protein RclHR1_14540002 [Rhizophagus clarus]|uniref:F-box domain-containing protein n=1 Tax=Rhizophagus clarus TaxID=94130 RepID=A0A2Z6QCZ0_9GLOM|nr:hypothetical protein RclHR1_14540002 [Rhizophagus clarus]GES81146.1 hypothetical protein GLOIN_2v1876445 [Rhizophagus clarus]
MPCQLPVDCINEILEYLEKDKGSLYSCILVNRLWCEITVRILWRNIWIVNPVGYEKRLKMESSILNALISCLPNKSKKYLHEKGILNLTQISRTSLFDYASFCKVLSIHGINRMIVDVFKGQKCLEKEIMKMFMKKVSLKKLSCYIINSNTVNLSFLHCPKAKNCLANLSKLSCNSNVNFFYKLSQICCNIQSLTIEFKNAVSNDLKILISSQNNLKYLSLRLRYDITDMTTDIIPSLTKHSNTLIKLKIEYYQNGPLSFIAKFLNLQELILSIRHKDHFHELNNKLQHVILPQLQIFKFSCAYPKNDVLVKFLENNGKNLKEFYISCEGSNDQLNLAIAKFCQNLKSLSILFDKIETLNLILNNCQQLESIGTRYDNNLLNEKELLGALAKRSPKNFYKLKLFYNSYSELTPEDLEEFFINWKNRVSQRPFSFIFRGCKNSLEAKEGNMGVIEKYKKLGIIFKFLKL